jgi:hypothetical protein
MHLLQDDRLGLVNAGPSVRGMAPQALAFRPGLLTLFLMPMVNTILGAYQVAVTPDYLQGWVLSILALIESVASPIGPVAAELIIERWGETAVLLTIGLVMLVVTTGHGEPHDQAHAISGQCGACDVVDRDPAGLTVQPVTA